MGRVIDADKLLQWIESHDDADPFWWGPESVTAFDKLTDEINIGAFDPAPATQEIKIGETVRIPGVETGHKVTDIQYVHDRFQLEGVSGWLYGIDRLQRC